MKIVIFTGGTGSIALQRGLYRVLEENLDGFDTKIIVNAYDNGLSTGVVRRVMDGQILGPSDVRKNQATRLGLKDPGDPWLKFLDCRFTIKPSDAQDFCTAQAVRLVQELEATGRNADSCRTVFDAIEVFFRAPIASQIEYDNFSLANVIYAGVARANGNSLRSAGRIMAAAMDIPDNVLLNDDKSLFLGAITRSGRRIADEGDIVTWGNREDSFVDIFFTDADGNDTAPELCLESWQAILEADLVILSAGTQWSSLIPTYASGGFKTAINASNATVLMIMNRTPDKDSPGQTASDIVNVLVPRYFDEGGLHVLTDERSHPNMRCLDRNALAKTASFTRAELSKPADPADKHDPVNLVEEIGRTYFNEYLDSGFFLFDYDDTLCARANKRPKSSRFNISGIVRLNELTGVGVCTGNTIRALQLKERSVVINGTTAPVKKPLLIFADGGVNEYSYDTQPLVDGNQSDPDVVNVVRCVAPDTLLPTEGHYSVARIVDALTRAGVPASRIDNRGNALIAIKSVDRDYRCALMSLIRRIVYGSDLEVRECGTTTVEIRRPGLSKICALRHLCSERSSSPRITYVGDELESGNDHDIDEFAAANSSVKCLRVEGPAKTAFFISTLIAHLEKHAKH